MSTNKVKEIATKKDEIENTEVNISLRKLQETLLLLEQQRDKYADTAGKAHDMSLKADGAMDVLRQLIQDVQKEEIIDV